LNSEVISAMTKNMPSHCFAWTGAVLNTGLTAPVRLPEKVNATARLARREGTTMLARKNIARMLAATPMTLTP